jgi:hypothetical protein
MHTLIEECLWRTEWLFSLKLMSALEAWFTDDNQQCLHSVLGDKPPRQFEWAHHFSRGTQLPAA